MIKTEGIELKYKNRENKEGTEIGIEIAYNEEFKLHAVIKRNDKTEARKGIVIGRNGEVINSFNFNKNKEVRDITAVEYLDGFLEADIYKGIYNAMLEKIKKR